MADLLYFQKDWKRCGPAFDSVVPRAGQDQVKPSQVSPDQDRSAQDRPAHERPAQERPAQLRPDQDFVPSTMV